MAADRELVLYACVADGTTIVADFVRDDLKLETLASRCLQLTPAHHAVYTHTVDCRSYDFLIGERFVMFGIFDEALEKAKRLGFLEKMRDGFDDILGKNKADLAGKLGYRSLQGEMGEVFRRLMDEPFERISYENGLVRLVRDERSKNLVPMQLGKGLMKKKKRGAVGEMNDESREETDRLDAELSREMLGFRSKNGGRQRTARSRWKKRAWVVLFIDLIVCLVLFGVWLYICHGFKCLSGLS